MSDVQQCTYTPTLAAAVTVATPQAGVSMAGYNGAQTVEAVAVGTVAAQAVTFQFEGSFDGTHWYALGYQQTDAIAAPARVASGTTLTPGAGTVRHVYQILDAYPQVRVNPTANTLSGAGAGLTCNAYAMPV